jgi:predicted ATP-dependent endonuclease of OLD family
MNEHEGHLPIQDKIDVISVKGVQARRFLALAKNLPIRIAVVTDNDQDYTKNVTEKYREYISENVNVFSNTDNKQYTLEPSFAACNNVQELKDFLCPDYNGKKSISDWMEDNKSEWSLKIFSEDNNFAFPQYIKECIVWISK